MEVRVSMSIMFRNKSVRKASKEKETPAYGHRTVKYIELYGTVAALGAGLSSYIINYDIPDGHGAELFALGIEPDFAPGPPAVSNLLETEIFFDNKGTGIRFLTNHLGLNALPYGDRGSRQDIRLLDYPMRRGNLTPKFSDAMALQVRITARAAGAIVSTVRARAKVLLYEDADAVGYFGVPQSQMPTIPGGVQQAIPNVLFADYVNAFVSAGKAQWEDAYTKALKEYEQVQLTHLGVLPDANSDEAKVFDLREKWEAPEYEPYWKILTGFNALPFGDDDDYRETQKLPSVVAAHVYTNTTMKVQVKDLAVASTISAQLLGSYRRTR